MNDWTMTLSHSDHYSPVLAEHVCAAAAAAGINLNAWIGVSSWEGRVESALKVEMYEATTDEMFGLWRKLQHGLGLGCAWIDGDEYSGCILKHPEWPHGQHACTGSNPLWPRDPNGSGVLPHDPAPHGDPLRNLW